MPNGHPVTPPIRIAFVGAGKMARLHLRALRRVRTPHVVVAACDAIEGAAHQFATLAEATPYTSLAELLREKRPHLVHVCTPAGMHFEPARAALLAGAHVHIEKPFVETTSQARDLLDVAAERGLIVCAGHQQVRDPAYVELARRVPELGEIVQVDCHFEFKPPGMRTDRTGPSALAGQLLDILPHPLYTLVAMLEQTATDPSAIELTTLTTSPTDLHAVLRSNGAYGRLSVSLRGRPVASTLSVCGTHGTLTADFIRTSVVGAANTGAAPLEKVANPLVEAWQTGVRSIAGVARRALTGGDYPGLTELIEELYDAAARGLPSPLAPHHLRRVTGMYEEMAAQVRGAAQRVAVQLPQRPAPAPTAPLAVITGARGFFGKAIARRLADRGYRVRGVSRSADAEDPNVHEWRRTDLSRAIPSDAFDGAAVVVHAAVGSSGFEDHQRNTIDATRNVLEAVHAAGVTKLVHVSSLSVLRPPKVPWERLDERTPLAPYDARRFGAYAWAKTEAERIVQTHADSLGVKTRILRPAALVDWTHPEMPGFIGRHLFGRWHLGLGRPSLPFPSCEVGCAAELVVWLVDHFDDAPSTINLIDPSVATTRGGLLARFRVHGWRGRVFWMPISLFAALFSGAQAAFALATFRRPSVTAVWSILRPRRYDTSNAARLLQAVARDREATPEPLGAEARR